MSTVQKNTSYGIKLITQNHDLSLRITIIIRDYDYHSGSYVLTFGDIMRLPSD